MIELRVKGLPNAIEVNGKPYLIKTDYRDWLKFGELLKKTQSKPQVEELFYLFCDEIPESPEFVNELFLFYASPEVTPRDDSTSETLVDFVLDGSYIYASFMQAYQIDLVDTDLHWHKFMALFRGLPDNVCIKNIMSIRGYKKNNKSYEQCQQDARNIWSLPKETMTTEEQEEINSEINEMFYNA